MPLKSSRNIIETDTTLTCSSVTHGGVTLVRLSGGSGVVLGEGAGAAGLVTNPSGYRVAGLLLNDVVDIDLSRYRLSFHRDEVNIGNRVTLLTKGRVTTNNVTGTPSRGATAYLGANGVLTPTLSATGGEVATPKVGEFVGGRDEDGYATVDVDLPIA
jgi:hypothetical protein